MCMGMLDCSEAPADLLFNAWSVRRSTSPQSSVLLPSNNVLNSRNSLADSFVLGGLRCSSENWMGSCDVAEGVFLTTARTPDFAFRLGDALIVEAPLGFATLRVLTALLRAVRDDAFFGADFFAVGRLTDLVDFFFALAT